MKAVQAPETRRCSCCAQEKPLSEFSKNRIEADGISRRCKECCRAACRSWYARNKGKATARVYAYRRATPKYCTIDRLRRTLGRENVFTSSQWISLCDKYGCRCALCGSKGTYRSLTVDHIIPVSRGGASLIDNIQPLCNQCNTLKWAHQTPTNY